MLQAPTENTTILILFRCWRRRLLSSLPPRPVRCIILDTSQYHCLRALLIHWRPHHHSRCLVRSFCTHRARWLHLRRRKSHSCQCDTRLQSIRCLARGQPCYETRVARSRDMGRQAVCACHEGGGWLVGQGEAAVAVWPCAVEDQQANEERGRQVSGHVPGACIPVEESRGDFGGSGVAGDYRCDWRAVSQGEWYWRCLCP